MNIKTLFAGLGLLAAQTLAAQNILVAPVNPGTSPSPNFGGECTRSGRIGWAEVKSVSFSMASASASAAVGSNQSVSGKVAPGKFIITKKLDGSSQFFLSNCMASKIIPMLTIEYISETGSGEYLGNYQIITLYDVVVSSYEQGKTEYNEEMQEVIGLSYSSISVVYNRVNRSGGIINGKPYGWNWKTNSPMP